MKKNLLSRLGKTLSLVEGCRCCRKSSCRHPEFISGSQESKEMLNPVQHDGYSTGKMPNPVQHDDCVGWRRTSISLGRSMIEMLGVLAIIGVLSIGGLYAYRQAMVRYQNNKLLSFIDLLHLTANELCLQAEKCPFGPGSTLYYSKTRELICAHIGNNPEYCTIMSDWSRLTFLPNSAGWIVYDPYHFTDNPGKSEVSVQIRNLSADACIALVNHIGPIKAIRIGDMNFITIRGKISGTTKQDLIGYCKTNLVDYGSTIVFIWTREYN